LQNAENILELSAFPFPKSLSKRLAAS